MPLTLIVVLAGCAGLKGTQLTSEDLDQTAVRVHQSSLSDGEKAAFDELRQRADSGEYDVTGKTVGQVIADQLAYDADQKAQSDKAAALAAQVKVQHDDSVRRLQDALTVALVDKGFQDSDPMAGEYQSEITLELAFKNNSPKTIRAVKGVLDFQNSLGDSIHSVTFEHDLPISPGRTEEWDGSLDFNQFDQSLVQLRDTGLRGIHLRWEPSIILFSDGTRLVEAD